MNVSSNTERVERPEPEPAAGMSAGRLVGWADAAGTNGRVTAGFFTGFGFGGATWRAFALAFFVFVLATVCFGVAGALLVAAGGLDCTGAGGGELTAGGGVDTGAEDDEELEELWLLPPVVAGFGFDWVC